MLVDKKQVVFDAIFSNLSPARTEIGGNWRRLLFHDVQSLVGTDTGRSLLASKMQRAWLYAVRFTCGFKCANLFLLGVLYDLAKLVLPVNDFELQICCVAVNDSSIVKTIRSSPCSCALEFLW